MKDRDIKHIRTAVYHPAANGAIKRFLRVLRESIQSAILQQKPWKATVTEFLQVYRATTHPSSCCMAEKYAHASMSFLRHRQALTLMCFVRECPPVRKKYTDSRRGAHVTSFKEEDRVRVRKPFHVPKAHSRDRKSVV